SGPRSKAFGDGERDIGIVRTPEQRAACRQPADVARPVMFKAQSLRRAIEAENCAALVLAGPLSGLLRSDVGGQSLICETLGERCGLAQRHEDFAEDWRVPYPREAMATIVAIDHRVGN